MTKIIFAFRILEFSLLIGNKIKDGITPALHYCSDIVAWVATLALSTHVAWVIALTSMFKNNYKLYSLRW